jgi:hypothetical protein
MTVSAITGATAGHAAKIQEDHADDGTGICGFCLRHFGMQVPFGTCYPYQLAQAFIDDIIREKERAVSRPPTPRVEFARPGGRVWPPKT